MVHSVVLDEERATNATLPSAWQRAAGARAVRALLRLAERRRPTLLWLWALPLSLLVIPLGQPLLAVLRLLDSGICAQLPTHMLAPGGITLPLCARNTGIYSGAALAFGIVRARGRQRAMLPPAPPLVAVLLLLIGIMAVDGLNSVANDLALPHLYAPSNALRLATGLGAGTALALLLAPVIARALYGAQDQRPPLAGITDLLPFGAAAVLAYTVIWSSAPWTLYPVALLSNAGLLAVLVGLNRIALSSGRADPGAGSSGARDAAPLAVLIPLCLAELALLAGMRVLLVG